MRRRFVSLVIAIAFSVLCYAYLYQICYPSHFVNWPNNFTPWLSSMHFSLTNSIKGSGTLVPVTDIGLFVMTSQFISTYIFLAMMISRSIPQFTQKKEVDKHGLSK